MDKENIVKFNIAGNDAINSYQLKTRILTNEECGLIWDILYYIEKQFFIQEKVDLTNNFITNMMKVHMPKTQDEIIYRTKEQILESWDLDIHYYGNGKGDILHAMTVFSYQQCMLFAEYRDNYKKEEHKRIKKEQERVVASFRGYLLQIKIYIMSSLSIKKIIFSLMENPKWELAFHGNVCIGVKRVISKDENGEYYEMVFNTVLPDTDEQYEQQKEKIEGTMRLICELYNNLQNGLSYVS